MHFPSSALNYGRQKQDHDSAKSSQAAKSPLYSKKDLFTILADGTVSIAPSISKHGPAHVHRTMDWVLRREDPDTRALILKALEDNRTKVDIPALREVFRLSSGRMDVFRKGFGESRLPRLSAEQAPFPSSPQAVVEALEEEVQRMHKYLPMRDVLTLAKFGAHEIERRCSGEQIPAEYQAAHLYQRWARFDCFKGRTLEDDPLLKCEPGPIELAVEDQLAKAEKNELGPLTLVAARWLSTLCRESRTALQEEKKEWAQRICTVYPVLLAHCFSLGEDGPQRMHRVLQHHVQRALDMLGTGDRAGEGAGHAGTTKKRTAGELDAAKAPGSVEYSRQQARADEWQVVAIARDMLTGEFRLQNGLRCLEHAYNNASFNWLALHRPGTPFVPLSLPDEAQELSRIDSVAGPDGYPMQRLRLMPQQLRALMPELEAHLDLAIVFKGPTNLNVDDSQVTQTHHYTALIKVDVDDAKSVHFELESLATDTQAGKRWLPSLQHYLEGLQGGAYMGIRGADDHALSKYVKLMAIEPFWKTCEALGVLLGKQPIIELAKFLPVNGMEDAARQIDANFAVAFCRDGLLQPNATSHETNVPEGNGRSKAIVDWLDTLGTNEAILWTGTDPMVMAVAHAAPGEWFALDSGTRSRRPLVKVLDWQQSLFKGLAPDVHVQRAGFARALTLLPPAVHVPSPALEITAVQHPTWRRENRNFGDNVLAKLGLAPVLRAAGELASQQVLRAFKDYPF